jgi:signal peptidase II
MLKANRAVFVLFLVSALGCVGCDQVTKDIARHYLTGAPATELAFGAIQLLLVENPGAFMSLGATLPETLRDIIFTIGVPSILLVLSGTFLTHPGLSSAEAFALAIMVGGGAGNWLDRILRDGMVTDFLRLSVGPLHTAVFNVADVAILFGVGLLLVSHWRNSERLTPETESTRES